MPKKPSLVATAVRPNGRAASTSIEALIHAVQQTTPEAGEQRRLPIDRLQRGRYQPRQVMPGPAGEEPELRELADSIRALGVIEPIAVRPLPDAAGDFEILAGDRRWRAARLAGLVEVPVIVHAVDDRTAAAMALVENVQRQDLNPLETATAMQRLRHEFGLSQEELGRLLGLSKSMISRTLGLLSLPEAVQQRVRSGELEAGHARTLLTLAPEEQVALAEQAVVQGWSVRELEQRKAALAARKATVTPSATTAPPHRPPLETRLGSWLATPVRLTTRKNGGGTLVIGFTDAAERARLLQKIGYPHEEL